MRCGLRHFPWSRGRGRAAALAGGAVIGLLATGETARADAIDGNWCAGDGRTLTIAGPRLVTPGGASITGDYDRHGFAYVVPPGEPGAGGRVAMVLLNEDTVRIVAGLEPAIWHRCDVVS
ncbi:MAG TPA: hypothetical protein VFG43_10530 [Geminicoccaceae bacterium]|nr:hypothetical protein [Geminicoccaceae bacterium]